MRTTLAIAALILLLACVCLARSGARGSNAEGVPVDPPRVVQPKAPRESGLEAQADPGPFALENILAHTRGGTADVGTDARMWVCVRTRWGWACSLR